MTAEQILSLGSELADYLDEFHDCFARSEPRGHLSSYVRGQLSDLLRKSIEPIADFVGTPARTLQEFLDLSSWSHRLVRDRVQQIVARDYADPQAIGIIDDSGHPKSGYKTAGVQHQWCGNLGKMSNCVVTVHLSYVSNDTRFRTMLDSDLYLPDSWDDPDRRAEAGIPDEVVYQDKRRMAVNQVAHALENGLSFDFLTFDGWYSRSHEFLVDLENLKQRYVAQINDDFYGWLGDPRSNTRLSYRDVKTLCRHSSVMLEQPWQRVHVKDTQKGPMVWEFKCAPFWIQYERKPRGPYWLVFARNVLDPNEEKYFLSNAMSGTPVERILHVAFTRHPIERTLEDQKDELGMSHFEVRKYDAIMKHLAVTQVSHLFIAIQAERLRGEKSGDHHLPSPHRRQCHDRRAAPETPGPELAPRTRFAQTDQATTTERRGSPMPYPNTIDASQRTRNQPRRPPLLHPKIECK